jgi:hypothetical protein
VILHAISIGQTTFESTLTYNLVLVKFQDEHMTLIYAWKNNKTNDEKQRQITNAFVNGGLNLGLFLPNPFPSLISG